MSIIAAGHVDQYDAGGVSQRDIDLAKFIDSIAGRKAAELAKIERKKVGKNKLKSL